MDKNEEKKDPEIEKHLEESETCESVFGDLSGVTEVISAIKGEFGELPKSSVERPSQYGNYQLGKMVSEGGMGQVWEATDTVLHRRVAVKVMKESLSQDKDYTQRFLSEARIVAKLNHPNIVQIYQAGQVEGDLFIAMEFVEGDWIYDHRKGAGVSWIKAKPLFRQVLEGIKIAHQEGIVHRDIKPSNIMLDHNDRVKILDFGLAKSNDEDLRLTTTGQVMGTVSYLAPEVVAGQGYTMQSDIFALGLVLFEMLTGKNPFLSDSALATLENIRSKDIPVDNLSKLDGPPTLAHLIRKMCERDPEKRYKNMEEVIRDFDSLETSSLTQKAPAE